MSDGKREIIARLIEEYDIRSAEDIQNALRDLLGRIIQGMMEGEMETQKKEKQEEDPAYTDSRNGYKTKTLRSNYGPVEVNVPQDRKSDYDPKIVPKYGRDISEIDEKIIRLQKILNRASERHPIVPIGCRFRFVIILGR